jgi:hypothetical protein
MQHPPHIPSAINALDNSFLASGSCERNAIMTLGEWRIKNQRANIVPSRKAAHWSSHLLAMLIPAAMKAVPDAATLCQFVPGAGSKYPPRRVRIRNRNRRGVLVMSSGISLRSWTLAAANQERPSAGIEE